jgi:Rab-like protein 2
VTSKTFAFATKNGLPLYYVSAADGTNVVKVFRDAVDAAWAYKHSEKDFIAEVRWVGGGGCAGDLVGVRQ